MTKNSSDFRKNAVSWLMLVSMLLPSGATVFAAPKAPAPTNPSALDKAFAARSRNVKILEGLDKRYIGTAKERDFTIRLVSEYLQLDRLSKQREMAKMTAAQALSKNKTYLKKLEFFTSRFIERFSKDHKVYWMLSIRGRAREDLGDISGMFQDFDTVVRMAPHNTEEWLKASVKLGEYYRAKGDLQQSESILNAALKGASKDWSVFILEALLITQSQVRAWDRALLTINQIFVRQGRAPSAQTDALMNAKGQVLAKLFFEEKIGLDTYFDEFKTYSPHDKVTILKVSMLELTVVNRESLSLQMIKHPDFVSLDSGSKLTVTSDLAVLLYDQKSNETLEAVLREIDTYPVAKVDANNKADLDATLKRVTELSQKIQSAIAKDPRLAMQSEGRTLEALYNIVVKVATTGGAILSEARYNKASLFVIQERFEEAYPIFRGLNGFKDSEDKFATTFVKALKKSKVIPDSWMFVSTGPQLKIQDQASVIKDLDKLSVQYCNATAFREGLCFGSLKGLVKIGKTDTLEKHLKPIIFEPKRTQEEKEQAFSALFDFFQSGQQHERSAAILNIAEKRGVRLNPTILGDARKTVQNQTLVKAKKLFEEGKNAELLAFTKAFEVDADLQVFPELFAFTGLAAQKLGDDTEAQKYYFRFDEVLDRNPKIDTAMIDLVAVGHAIAFERSYDYWKASSWWVKVRSWKDSSQKRLALNAIWLAADLNRFKQLLETPKFCEKVDATLCEEFQRLFVATWPVFYKEFSFEKKIEVKSIVDRLVVLQLNSQLGQPKNLDRLSMVIDTHDNWSKLDPVKQIALFPHFQRLLKDEVSNWLEQETGRFARVSGLMDFQAATKAFKSNEAALGQLLKSNWTDFQVYADVASALVYEAMVKSLDRAKTKDGEILAQDPGLKKMFDDTSKSLSLRQKEILDRGLKRTQNFAMDLSIFEGLEDRYPEWKAIAKGPVKTAPRNFFGNLTGKAKVLKDNWISAFEHYNWPMVAYTVVQLGQDASIDSSVAQAFEAETFLRFGNRIDSQKQMTSMFGLESGIASTEQAIPVFANRLPVNPGNEKLSSPQRMPASDQKRRNSP